MTDPIELRKCIRARKRIEHKLDDLGRKLDHLIFRLRKEDPRVYSDKDDIDEQMRAGGW